MDSQSREPIIGITADMTTTGVEKYQVGRKYVEMVVQAGGVPMILPCVKAMVPQFIDRCDGIILTGGDDPKMEVFGVPTHPKATPLHPQRQEFELALLAALDQHQHTPTLGICLGMQLMGLHAGGTIDQHLPDQLATAEDHWDKRRHMIQGEIGAGEINSHHRQALTDAGAMRVVARAHDGVIEAIRRDDRPFYLGVQWHPERTDDPALGLGIIKQLVDAARRSDGKD